MYLKALEIQGFKSFPEKKRLVFDKNVTAIVGPNGSGKSNISDAVRWVMGEQSTKALRGGKMEDVIFGGTEKRRQVGYAQVSLILDNSDRIFDMDNAEVMVTRRYYRSGESEYYINQQQVRLKDVNELFMDTGLGREGYSVIGQGRIDEILSVKSTERREIFEEAAGISRFRHRKEEASRKLERAEESLVRINDKISELEYQVEPLRKQSETAKKYLMLRDSLRGLEISLWMDSLDAINAKQEKLAADIQSGRDDLQRAQLALDTAYSDMEKCSQKLRDKDVKAEEIRHSISILENEAAEGESAAAVLNANLSNNLDSIDRINEELVEHDSQDSGITAQISQRKERLLEVDRDISALEADFAEIEKENSRLIQVWDKAAVELEKIMEESRRITDETVEKKESISSLAASLQEMEDRDTSLGGEISLADERLREAEKDGADCRKDLDKAMQAVTAAKNIITGYEMRVSARTQKANAAADKKMKLTMEQNTLKSRIKLLTEMEKEFQGYSRAVKMVMQEAGRGSLRGICGPVADLIKTDDKYTVAIETALGSGMQNIVVRTEADGKAAINLLKRRDGGRATFLPLTSVKGRKLEEYGLENEDGYEGNALELLSYSKEYEAAFASLLGRTVVAIDLDAAIRISRKYAHRFKIVTLDGQVINAGGSMTGGSTGTRSGILSRANELEKLHSREGEMDRMAAEAESRYEAAVREKTASEYELGVAQDDLREKEDNLLRLQSKAQHFDVLIATLRESRQGLIAERDSLRQRIEAAEADIAQTRKELEALNIKSGEVDSKAEQESRGREELMAERQALALREADIKAKKASLEAESAAVKAAMEELEALRTELSGGRERQEKLLASLIEDNERLKHEISDKEQLVAGLRAKIKENRDKIAKIANEKMELEAMRTRLDRDTQDRNRAVIDCERECARLDQAKLSVELEEKQIIDKLWDNYELTRSAAMTVRQPLDNVNEASQRVTELRREISRLGNPNIGAIEEYERVYTRYTYLTEQRDDIQKSKDELLEIIDDITGQMKEVFAERFVQIKLAFKDTFRELFEGGSATLELEDPDDILNCGIEIKVQPPGKTLKIISLLSGGEKAFVAIALYFAILKVRPTPFVVMDEIEAALDDANVTKFARYLRSFTDKTQFLVITHRRGTMEEADVLYGVTMQEQGVSQVLMIDLEEAEKTIH
ncbi:MAG: chromosome segregation protein SMC [Ruminococcaceae bacterium]|nr:chromosome segregation protein SMC [Oscillospiraceae bacterium]